MGDDFDDILDQFKKRIVTARDVRRHPNIVNHYHGCGIMKMSYDDFQTHANSKNEKKKKKKGQYSDCNQGFPYIAMEFAEQGTLHEIIDLMETSGRKIPIKLVVQRIYQ